jgi:hypothetical protein
VARMLSPICFRASLAIPHPYERFEPCPWRIAAVLPQGEGRAYFCYHKASRARIQGDSDFPGFIEGCKRTGADPSCYDGAKAAGPLASCLP